VTRRIVVRGHVQGVGFRAFAVQVGRRLGLDGEVWNRSDGCVEAVVAGQEGAVDEFVAVLRTGPGRIDRIEWEDSGAIVGPGFVVGPTR
jgi:acylphosphatase